MKTKRMLACAAALACLLPGLAAAVEPAKPTAGDGQKIQAHILIVDSHAAIARWVGNPGGGDSGRMRQVAVGQKIYVPVVVTGLKTAEFGQPGISADFEFVAPGGKVLHAVKKCCGANRGDPKTVGLVVLNPVLDYESEPGDPLGTYELRATVIYGALTASASEKFELVAAAKKAAAPARPPAGMSRAHLDARSCLEFAENLAVMRCAEKFR